MIIPAPQTLARFRGKLCENCKERGGSCAAHVYARGRSNSSQNDYSGNVVALCWPCHGDSHWGREPTQLTLLRIVAKREGVAVESLKAAHFFLMRADKHWSPWKLEAAIKEQEPEVQALVRRALAEAGIMEVANAK